MDYTKDFLDKMNEINNFAKDKGFRNGKHMADVAFKANVITYSECSDFKNIHNLRNGGGHGLANDITVTKKTFDYLCRLVSKLKKSKLVFHKINKSPEKTNNKNDTQIKKNTPTNIKKAPGHGLETIKLFGGQFIIAITKFKKDINGKYYLKYSCTSKFATTALVNIIDSFKNSTRLALKGSNTTFRKGETIDFAACLDTYFGRKIAFSVTCGKGNITTGHFPVHQLAQAR